MIRFVLGNMFDADVEALVNPVNCFAKAGRGLDELFRQRFPSNHEAFAARCGAGEVVPGKMDVHDLGADAKPRWIINFPTKRHWRDPSRLEDIESGLVDLRRVIVELNIRSIAIPALSCGLGGLDWAVVKPRIMAALQDLPRAWTSPSLNPCPPRGRNGRHLPPEPFHFDSH